MGSGNPPWSPFVKGGDVVTIAKRFLLSRLRNESNPTSRFAKGTILAALSQRERIESPFRKRWVGGFPPFTPASQVEDDCRRRPYTTRGPRSFCMSKMVWSRVFFCHRTRCPMGTFSISATTFMATNTGPGLLSIPSMLLVKSSRLSKE